MRLSELLHPSRVLVDVRVGSRRALLELLARLLAPEHDLAVLESIVERETLGSTALGFGVALPHGRCAILERSSAAVLRLARPIEFGATDRQGVDLVFGLVTPSHYTEGHLLLLAEIATRCADPAVLARLRAAPDVASFANELAQWNGS